MSAEITSIATRLSGDWTINSIVSQANYLMSLSENTVAGAALHRRFQVDCSEVDRIDLSGLQLLYVWMQCLQIKGVSAELVNLSDDMRLAVQQFGLHTLLSCAQAAEAA